jgi:cytochrome c-type biogenesis protein CcmH/NrfG
VATELRENPLGVVTLEDAATINASLRHLASAVSLLRHAQRLDPTNPDILLSLARVYLREGARAKALPILEQAEHFAPHSEAVHRALRDARR